MARIGLSAVLLSCAASLAAAASYCDSSSCTNLCGDYTAATYLYAADGPFLLTCQVRKLAPPVVHCAPRRAPLPRIVV